LSSASRRACWRCTRRRCGSTSGKGLIAPSRTNGNLRLYSDRDIERLRQVKYLVEERGLNLAGVQLALELTNRLRALKARAQPQDGTRAANGRPEALCREMDAVLALLGVSEEAPPR
jgi:MerR family transcriptional regulator/heat shock protein HspR